MEYSTHYLNSLYPLQDKFLAFFNDQNHGQFYLTGGTALSRVYFQHRYSDDLDFFSVSEMNNFREVVTKILNAAKGHFDIEVETISDNFFRCFIKKENVSLKIDFVNELAVHFGSFNKFPLFASIDNEINILSNKICCVSRSEVKDIADIWILAKQRSFLWRDIIDIAHKKEPVDPIEISKIIKSMPKDELNFIKWSMDIDMDLVYSDVQSIAKDILLGAKNSLVRE